MDEEPTEAVIIPFKPKEAPIDAMPIGVVYVKDAKVGLNIPENLLLTPKAAADLCIVIISAIKAIKELEKDK